ncbi:NRDE family protein [Nocardia sp. 348MFTsu5.1]|uniref:NRDE family protein n=1 Tax=Nocardia sp. 348MFTsu5.1 TaxID=1172185 RepID=UPI00035FB6B2|nr:NRDE family protein [Nocardia sp. 348MFTsu5.1]
MCVAFLAWQSHPDYQVVLASNRDEFFWRKAQPLHVWPTTPRIAAGKDTAGGGTWLGADETGRFAFVTNIRKGLPHQTKTDLRHRSRGLLVTEYLKSGQTAAVWAQDVIGESAHYRPFNLVFGDVTGCFYLTNRPALQVVEIPKGIHGLSNASLNEPWPKVVDGVEQFRAAVGADRGDVASGLPYFDRLADSVTADRARLPDTGVGTYLETRLSSRFVKLGVYGTRSSSLLRITSAGHVEFVERRFGLAGRFIGETTVRLPSTADRNV